MLWLISDDWYVWGRFSLEGLEAWSLGGENDPEEVRLLLAKCFLFLFFLIKCIGITLVNTLYTFQVCNFFNMTSAHPSVCAHHLSLSFMRQAVTRLTVPALQAALDLRVMR